MVAIWCEFSLKDIAVCFKLLQKEWKIFLVFPTEVLYHSWSLLIAGEIKCRFRADILVGLTPFNLRISICNLFVYFSFPFQFGEYSA